MQIFLNMHRGRPSFHLKKIYYYDLGGEREKDPVAANEVNDDEKGEFVKWPVRFEINVQKKGHTR